jgi:hypothetical protein
MSACGAGIVHYLSIGLAVYLSMVSAAITCELLFGDEE